MSTVYEAVPQRIEAGQFDGSDVTRITGLAGEENVSFRNGHLQVRVSDGRWEDILRDWWVLRFGDGSICVASGAAFARHWKKADGSHAGAE